MTTVRIQSRVHGSADLPTIIYLPGLHGDWTLVSSFRAALTGRARFVEFTYPCEARWALDDYAQAVVDQLASDGINSGWIVGESFSSQVAWKIIERSEADRRFAPCGLILAGGFVRHPVIAGVRCFHAVHRLMPWRMFRLLLKFYARYARLRHRHALETMASIAEFVERRTPADRDAIASRYPLIAHNDLRSVARVTKLPIYALTGFFDPIVPWPFVHPWLQRNCPGFHGRRIILNADHNVLGTAPEKSAKQVMSWIGAETNRLRVDAQTKSQ